MAQFSTNNSRYKAHTSIFFLVLMFSIAQISLISAELGFDNVKSFDSKIGKYGKITIKDNFGLADLYEAELKTNTDVCAESCSAETEIVLHQTTSLIDEVRFMTQLDSGEKEEAIRSYQFYIQTGGTNITVDDYDWVSIGKHGNGSDILEWQKVGSHIESAPEWTPYTLGTEMSAGTYQVKLEGKKKPSRTVDWQITTQGKLIDEWALWGGSLIDGNLLTALPLNGTEGSTAFPDYASSSADAPHTWTSTGGAHINTSLADPWGNNDGVARFNQSNFISAPDSDDWDCSGGANCTIDAWVYVHTLPPSGADSLWGQEDGTTGDWFTYIYNDGRFTTGISGVRELNSPAGVISAGQWYHLAVVKDDGTTKTYVDGLEQASGALEYFTASTEIMRLGGTPNQLANVSISMFRFSNVSRWTQNFTPPGPFGSGQGEITLDSPVNNYVSTEFSAEFNCSATAGTGANVNNISLWHNGTGTWHRNQTLFGDRIDMLGTLESDATGLINNALNGDGGADWHTAEGPLVGYNNFSISFWYDTADDEGQTTPAVLWSGGSGANSFYITKGNCVGGGGDSRIYFNGESCQNLGVDLETGTYRHIVIMGSSSNNYTVYVDNVMRVTNSAGAYTFSNGGGNITLNVDNAVTTAGAGDSWDEVGVWDKLLTTTEISDLYNGGSGITYGNANMPSGLKHYWTLDEASDAREDSVGFALEATASVSFTATLTDPTLWSCSATDSDNDEGFALENRTITFDAENPIITIFSPTSNIDYGYTGFNQSLNFSVTDDGTLSSCWFSYKYPTINQSFTTTSDNYWESTTSRRGGQTFQFSRNIVLDKIAMKLGRTGTPGIVNFSIYNVAGGVPTTLVAQNTTWNANDLVTGTTGAWFNISIGASLIGGTTYAFIIENTTTATVHYRGVNAGGYGDGTRIEGNPGWSAEAQDLVFEVFSDGNTFTNTTLSCTTNSSLLLEDFNNTQLIFYANDTVGNLNSTTINWNYSIWENSKVFNTTVWELEGVGNSINVTANSSLTAAGIVWDGTSYAATQSGEIWTSSFTIPEGTGSKQFYWNFTFGGNNIQSPTTNVTVNSTQLALCNTTLTVPYVNFTFKDEDTDTAMTAFVDSSTWTYWIGDSSVSKELLYSSPSTIQTNYTFCFTPSHLGFTTDLTFKYSNTSYPQRTWTYDDQALTNSTTEQTLYLLATADGIYVAFQVVDSSSSPIESVNVNITRVIGGETVLIGQGVTGGDGVVTFFLNPDYPHTLSASKSGYTSVTETLTPTQTQYTIQMGGGIGTVSTQDLFKGVNYNIYPKDSYLLSGTTYEFNLTMSSTFWTITDWGFSLLNDSNAVLNTTSATSNGGTLSRTLNTGNLRHISMTYYYVVNGSRVNMERHSWGVFNESNTNYSLTNFFTHLKAYTNTDDPDEGFFGLTRNGLGLLSFFFVFILTGVISYKFNFTNPALISFTAFILIFIFDVVLDIFINPVGRINNFMTYFSGIIMVGLFIKEWAR